MLIFKFNLEPISRRGTEKVLWIAERIAVVVPSIVFFQVEERIIDLDSNEAAVEGKWSICWSLLACITSGNGEA